MIKRLKHAGACGFCCVGAVALSVLAVGAADLAAGPDQQSAVPAVALADDGREHEQAPAVQSQVDAVVRSYLTVQKQLAQDKTEGIAEELKTMHEAAKELGNAAEDEKLKKQAQAVAKHAQAQPKDVKEARASFKSLSSAVIGLVQIAPPTDDIAPALYEANCPMAKANWLQTTKEITNPYMGQKMLECGSIEQTIKAPAGGEEKEQASVRSGSSCCSIAAAAPACH